MNPITHFELPVNEKSKKFYQDTFGWDVIEMPEMNYTIVRTSEIDDNNMPKNPGAVNGGFTTVEEIGEPKPVLVIDVPSIEGVLSKAKNEGLKIVMPKTKVGSMGWYARFIDHAGVLMGVWETIKETSIKYTNL